MLFAHKCLYFARVLRFCETTMKVLARRFNIYLALITLVGLASGCLTSKADKQIAVLRVHIETDADSTGTSQPISVLRSEPVLVTIKREPALTEANLVTAKVIEVHGGFAIQIKFDENGTWLLEQYSAANPGRHFAIFGGWVENDFPLFSGDGIFDPSSLARKLTQSTDAVSLYVKSRLSPATLEMLAAYQGANSNPAPLQAAMAEDLNRIIQGPLIYEAQRFGGIVLREKTQQLLAQESERTNPLHLNRLLLEDAYPVELSRKHKNVSENRWLAAPMISRRISDGVLAFTPDCDHEEAAQLVLELNNTAKELHK